MKLSTTAYLVQGIMSKSPLSRELVAFRVGAKITILKEIGKQIPAAQRLVRAIEQF